MNARTSLRRRPQARPPSADGGAPPAQFVPVEILRQEVEWDVVRGLRHDMERRDEKRRRWQRSDPRQVRGRACAWSRRPMPASARWNRIGCRRISWRSARCRRMGQAWCRPRAGPLRLERPSLMVVEVGVHRDGRARFRRTPRPGGRGTQPSCAAPRDLRRRRSDPSG